MYAVVLKKKKKHIKQKSSHFLEINNDNIESKTTGNKTRIKSSFV